MLPETSNHSSPRLLASFGRRRGRRLRTGKQSLIDTLLPKLDVRDWGLGIGEKISSPNAKSLIPNLLWLEIGFGGGEHLAYQAERNPNVALIGCEPYVNGMGELLKQIETKKLSNIRLYGDDARPLIDQLPDACLSRVFILYPDPWPKSRHHKRRIVAKPLLDSLARAMKPGAELRLATDHADYACWMLEQLLSHPSFLWQAARCDDWLKPWPDYTPTRYEQKALAGRPTYLTFICHPRA